MNYWAFFGSMGPGQWFPRYRPIFKIAIFGHETWPLAKVPEVAHTGYTLFSTPWGRNWAYFRSMGSGFRDTDGFSKFAFKGMTLSYWPQFQKSRIFPPSTPWGSKLSLFLLYRQRFPRYKPIFKIAILIFWHETWPSTKVPEVAHILFTPEDRNWA